LKELLFAAVLAIHAAVFARFYLRRGRRGFHALLVGGFSLLTVSYLGSSLVSLAGIEPTPAALPLVRWSGFALCALATPPFLVHWYRRRRGDPAGF
jgi:hypothetical protein